MNSLSFELDVSDTSRSIFNGFASTALHVANNLQDKHQNTMIALKLNRPRHKGPSGAAALTTGLHTVEAHDALGHSSPCDTLVMDNNQLEMWKPARIASHIGSMLQPQGDTHNDDSTFARVSNIVTSLPLVYIGFNNLAQRRTSEGKAHAWSVVAVGAVAAAYHASSGKARKVLRFLDYWTISGSSLLMSKALFPERNWMRKCMNLSVLAIPFKPFLVSTAHTLAMQVEFAKEATKHQSVCRDFSQHIAAAALGAACFALEDPLAELGCDLVHPCWHLFAAYGVNQMCKLVNHKENMQLFQGLDEIKPLRSCHDSAGSLDGLEKAYYTKR